MYKINPIKLRSLNPCEQLQTSNTAIFKNKLNLSTNSQAIFCKECTHVYEDTDMMFQDYNPLMSESENSENNAQNFNESLNTSNYGKIA